MSSTTKKAPRVALVAVPLGNPDDLAPRARKALEAAGTIFCEDTRKLGALAERAALKLSARVVPLPGGAERDFDWARELERNESDSWALVSDAGTPLVNDPGQSLLEFARARGLAVEALPGPCAPILAWQWSGGFGLPFVFAGFAPKAKTPGVKALTEFFSPATACKTFAFFDTRHQVLTTLEHLSKAGKGATRLHCAREMTKPHEECMTGTVDELLADFGGRLARDQGLGELTFLLEGEVSSIARADTTPDEIRSLRRGTPKDAARVAAKLLGISVGEAYDLLQDRES